VEGNHVRVAGLIVEYNPFHNGHLYHLQETQKKILPDLVIAVMSGNFLQRGEPAILSKWRRAKLALEAGIDLVIELPYAYATQRAQIFAWGAVSLLDDLGVTDLCFGSENGDITPFYNTLGQVEKNRDTHVRHLKAFLKEGYSYPKAESLAFQALGFDLGEAIDLSQPNNILGYHYIEAIQQLGGRMKGHTIKRTETSYHDPELPQSSIASATAIRKHLRSKPDDWETVTRYVPSYTAKALLSASQNNELRCWEDYFPFLKYRLITDPADVLRDIYEAEEGLENRMKRYIGDTTTFTTFMSVLKTKRYTWTRLQRLLTHTLTHATKEEMNAASVFERPSYLRLLGMSKKGQAYLNQIKSDLRIPIISRLGKEKDLPVSLKRDLIAANCYQLVPTSEADDYRQTPLRF
jgi:predicted nucleotidyltransferase